MLYDFVEKNWYHGGSVYLYSDPHFSDDEMKYLRKNYIGDEEQVKLINKKVGKNDTIVILGDIGNIEWVKKIRGYKVLIMGNHDSGPSNYKREIISTFSSEDLTDNDKEELNSVKIMDIKSIIKSTEVMNIIKKKIKTNDNHLFDEVYSGPLFISDKILLSHEPIDYPYALNIHGHDHSNFSFQDNLHMNVCAEHINYTPVSLKDIIKSGVLKNIDDIHRATIDNATYKKEQKEKKEKERD